MSNNLPPRVGKLEVAGETMGSWNIQQSVQGSQHQLSLNTAYNGNELNYSDYMVNGDTTSTHAVSQRQRSSRQLAVQGGTAIN